MQALGFLRFRFLLAESQLFCEARIPGTDKRISDSIVKWNRLEPNALYAKNLSLNNSEVGPLIPEMTNAFQMCIICQFCGNPGRNDPGNDECKDHLVLVHQSDFSGRV